MNTYPKTAVVAGHCCVDCQPKLPPGSSVIPGTLTEVGKSTFSVGGMLKTGILLQSLGVETKTIGAYGDDEWGDILLKRLGPKFARDMIHLPRAETSYTIVWQRPGEERAFAHCPGSTNSTFSASRLDYVTISQKPLFLFGYLTLMRQMYLNHGQQAKRMFQKIKNQYTTTALDVTMIDSASEAGRLDWSRILSNVLPAVDIFMPSWAEILKLLGEENEGINPRQLQAVSQDLLDMGVAVVVIKLGEMGCYLRTTGDLGRLESAGHAFVPEKRRRQWLGREMFIPAWQVEAINTCGAGDFWIGGFLASLLRGEGPGKAAVWGNTCAAYRVAHEDPNRNPTMRTLYGLKRILPVGKIPNWGLKWLSDAKSQERLPVLFGPNDCTQ